MKPAWHVESPASVGGGAMPSGPGQPVGSGQQPVGARWGTLRILAVVLLIVAVFLVLGGLILYAAIQSAFPRGPVAVPAPVVWESSDVVVGQALPVVHGRLTFSTVPDSTSTLRVGINTGVPQVESHAVPSNTSGASAQPGPAALLSEPAIRLTAVVSSYTRTCLAPCELELGAPSDCESPSCPIAYDVTVELVRESVQLDASVSVTVTGVAWVYLGEHLPPGTSVDLTFEGVAEDGG